MPRWTEEEESALVTCLAKSKGTLSSVLNAFVLLVRASHVPHCIVLAPCLTASSPMLDSHSTAGGPSVLLASTIATTRRGSTWPSRRSRPQRTKGLAQVKPSRNHLHRQQNVPRRSSTLATCPNDLALTMARLPSRRAPTRGSTDQPRLPHGTNPHRSSPSALRLLPVSPRRRSAIGAAETVVMQIRSRSGSSSTPHPACRRDVWPSWTADASRQRARPARTGSRTRRGSTPRNWTR